MDSRVETYRHIQTVQKYLGRVISNLLYRQQVHDRSKLESPEVEYYDEYTPQLKGTTYGTPQYESLREAIKPGLDHHYAHNDHHPEYYEAPEDPAIPKLQAAYDHIEFGPFVGTEMTNAALCIYSDLKSRRSRVRGMNLVAVMEMLCDWKAASERHKDGDVRRSIEINQHRFGYSDELKLLMLNTLPLLEGTDAEVYLRVQEMSGGS